MPAQKVVEIQGRNQLRRLSVFLDVVYALLLFDFLQHLPDAEDMSWRDQPMGPLQLLIDNRIDRLRIVIGCGLTLTYWNLSNRLLSWLVRTDGKKRGCILPELGGLNRSTEWVAISSSAV